jgi:hypothetical protein
LPDRNRQLHFIAILLHVRLQGTQSLNIFSLFSKAVAELLLPNNGERYLSHIVLIFAGALLCAIVFATLILMSFVKKKEISPSELMQNRNCDDLIEWENVFFASVNLPRDLATLVLDLLPNHTRYLHIWDKVFLSGRRKILKPTNASRIMLLIFPWTGYVHVNFLGPSSNREGAFQLDTFIRALCGDLERLNDRRYREQMNNSQLIIEHATDADWETFKNEFHHKLPQLV